MASGTSITPIAISEASGGYHWDKLNGVNVDAGIFLSYIGLFSYYQFDNWSYQPSYVSSNTPWFFNGVRIQIFPSDKLKIEPWIINGWQSYQFVTFRLEGNHRAANVPYFSGEGGVTPPGGNAAPLGSVVPGWVPDLRKSENRMTAALLVKF